MNQRHVPRLPAYSEAQEEAFADRQRLFKDQDARAEWAGLIEQLLPGHTCVSDGRTYKWTAPAGTWRLELDYRAYGGPLVTVFGPPGGKWQLADHRPAYVEAFLRLVGAI